MGTSQTNGSFCSRALDETQAISNSINVTEGPKPHLAIIKALIRNEANNSQILRSRQRNAMLGKIERVFLGIELNCHVLLYIQLDQESQVTAFFALNAGLSHCFLSK